MFSFLKIIGTHMLRVWMALAHGLNFVMTRVMLGVAYVFIITPFGIVRRVFGRDPLTRTFDPRARTYWIARDAGASPMDNPF